MSAEPSIVAVIPTFSPTPDVLELVKTLRGGVDSLVVSDDGSPCTSDQVLRDIAAIDGVQLFRHRTNAGIARGLTDGLQLAQSVQAQWLLSLDQDSSLPAGYVEALASTAVDRVRRGESLGALGAETVIDGAATLTYPTKGPRQRPCTEEVIQTGTLWNVQALTSVGGFDESLRMDAVDAAACLALRTAGFTIGIRPGLHVDHRIGNSRPMMIAGRSVMVTGHSPSRRTSMLRNRLRLFPTEFAQSPPHAFRTIRRVAVNQALGLLVEGQRWEKAKATARGLLPTKTR